MIAVITTTVAKKKDALILGKKLLDQQLIVCSRINKCTSQYYWKGKYYEEAEYALVLKTTISKKKRAVKFIKRNHPYDIPMIISTKSEVNKAYLAWMDQQLN